MRNLLNNADFTRVINRDAGTAGTKKGTIVDMQGFNVATFLVAFQDVVNESEVTVQVAQGDVDNTANMTVSTAKLDKVTATASSLDNKMLIIEVVNPVHRFLELQVAIAAQNAPIDGAVCIRSQASVEPVVQGSTVVDSATFVSPGAA